MNAINYGKVKILARLGELMPAKTREEAGRAGGRGKKGMSGADIPFRAKTLVKFRKVAANIDKLEEYREACEGEDGRREPARALRQSGDLPGVGGLAV